MKEILRSVNLWAKIEGQGQQLFLGAPLFVDRIADQAIRSMNCAVHESIDVTVRRQFNRWRGSISVEVDLKSIELVRTRFDR